MKTHQEIDQRSLKLARAVVSRIDRDPERAGLRRARQNCQRWLERCPSRAHLEWQAILEEPWEEIRQVLLDESEEGKRLRQSNPFCGTLTPQERWNIYKEFQDR